MVKILPANPRKGFAESILGGLAESIPQVLQQRQAAEHEKQAIESGKKLLGIDLSGFDPDTRKALLVEGLKQKGSQRKLAGESEIEQNDFNTIKDRFGEKFANLWRAAPVGGKTELLKSALDFSARGFDVNQILENVPTEKISEPEEIAPEIIPQMKKGQLPKDFKWPDFSKRPQGYTPREWNEERRTWRKENAPLFEENRTKIKNIKRDELGIKKLSNLNETKKLPDGFERSLINPETGEFYGIAQLAQLASPESQEWVKEIARFQNRAKDAFGSRVTNFDLQSYMKQFPGLLNSPEGRKRILKMMNINNQLDSLYENSLNKVFKKYGLAGVPQEKADELARSFISDETEKLEEEFLKLDEDNLDEVPQGLSGRMVDVRGPDGQIYEVDESEVGELPEGYMVI